MAPSPFSHLLRHLSTASKSHNRHLLCPFARHLSLSPFSSSSLQSNPSSHLPKSPSSSLSARLSFVFEQIDQIEKERAEKDEALERIKAWRESKKIKQAAKESGEGSGGLEGQQMGVSVATSSSRSVREGILDEDSEKREVYSSVITKKKEIELVHPWPEWIEFVERLVQQNYFDHRRKDEDMMIKGSGLDNSSDMAVVEEEVFDFARDWKSVQTAVLNFGRDRFDIFRSLSRQDILILVGYGCPSSDRKVVFSAKLLRKHVHLDEGDVCSSCSLRNFCEKAYLLTNKEDEARTIDVVRVLLTYAFKPINESVENKSLIKRRSIKTVVRKLLHEVVKLSSVPIDPTLPPPVIKKRPPKVKQPPPPPKRRVGRDDIEMKKGDWLCPKCDFLNFAKNVICLQCDAKRPKRQLLPGEWECPQCNFLNYRRNMSCFHCEHKRPPDDYTENQMQMRHHEPKTGLERAVNRQEVSNVWNFDFDDDESDGADVAAFEYADASKTGEGTQSDPLAGTSKFRGPGDDSYPPRDGPSRALEGREFSGRDRKSHGVGFNDFDDEEEDDDIDNYKLEDPKKARREETLSVHFSDVKGDSFSHEGDDELSEPRIGRMSSRSSKRQPNGLRGASRGSAFNNDASGDDINFGSDDDLPVHPKWKSSHVADFRQRGSGRASSSHGPSRGRSFNSDEDDPYDNDDELNGGFRSTAGNRSRWDSDRREFRRGSDFGPKMNGKEVPPHMQDFSGRKRGAFNRQNGRFNEPDEWSNMDRDFGKDEKPRRVRINVR